MAAFALVSAGCAVQTAAGNEGSGGSSASAPDDEATLAAASAGSPRPSAEPMLGRVDPGVTMNATPGEGVGVFAEYESGGHWHLFWTCDTMVTGAPCAFDVKVSVGAGVIASTSSEQFGATDTLVTPSTPAAGEAGAIEARTLTTRTTSGLFFDTSPGATITVAATVGGLYSGGFLFWVQGGKVASRGTVTDPLMLVGASP